jgi:hypothetical protein
MWLSLMINKSSLERDAWILVEIWPKVVKRVVSTSCGGILCPSASIKTLEGAALEFLELTF